MAPRFIETKLLHEISPGRILSLGFGDIAQSEADMVCVSAYAERGFTRRSAVGAVSERIGYGTLERRWCRVEGPASHCELVEVEYAAGAGFRYVLMINMGEPLRDREQRQQSVSNNLKVGLQSAVSKINSVGRPLQLDVSAMGVQFGHVDRHKSFDLLSEWALALFDSCPMVSHVRLVAYDLDTFVDFFEALHRLKKLPQTSMALSGPINTSDYRDFKPDLDVAVNAMNTNNAKQVLVICRTVVEGVVRRMVQARLQRAASTLFGDTNELRDKGVIPSFIHSYLHTCRVVGNFANHTNFAPSAKDAQAVMFLTLRIVEWYLETF